MPQTWLEDGAETPTRVVRVIVRWQDDLSVGSTRQPVPRLINLRWG